nr:hypothetical protein [Tanacetum cinerariifolium]
MKWRKFVDLVPWAETKQRGKRKWGRRQVQQVDVETLTKMSVSEYVMANDSYKTQKNQEMSELLQIKKQELELIAAELEIRRMKNRQRGEAL